ncbi:MAG TPA: hypothetical protein VEL05_02395 [Candidatus Acidoferrum sp.]|nr:hypothetical protein [Candidatus Acidoferrum sp.]
MIGSSPRLGRLFASVLLALFLVGGASGCIVHTSPRPRHRAYYGHAASSSEYHCHPRPHHRQLCHAHPHGPRHH